MQIVQIPGPLREAVGLDAGHRRGPEGGRGPDAELGQLADNLGGLVSRGHPEAVVERGEAEPAQLLAQGVAGGPVLLGDRERHQAPHSVPRLGVAAEREDVPRALVEYLGRALAEPHERAPADLRGDQEPVPGQPAERGPGGRVADAELGQQGDQRGRRQRLGVLPPVVPEQRQQQPGRPLGHAPRPRLGAVVAGQQSLLVGRLRLMRDGHSQEGIQRPCAMTTAITGVHSDARQRASMLSTGVIDFPCVIYRLAARLDRPPSLSVLVAAPRRPDDPGRPEPVDRDLARLHAPGAVKGAGRRLPPDGSSLVSLTGWPSGRVR